MDDLVEWLRTQFDDDERTARAVPVDLGHAWSDPGPWVMAGNGGGGREAEVAKAADGLDMLLAEHVARHIAEHDPARVLREIDAKRRMLARHAARYSEPAGGIICAHDGHRWPCPDVRDFAAAYADRPGYKESWRP